MNFSHSLGVALLPTRTTIINTAKRLSIWSTPTRQRSRNESKKTHRNRGRKKKTHHALALACSLACSGVMTSLPATMIADRSAPEPQQRMCAVTVPTGGWTPAKTPEQCTCPTDQEFQTNSVADPFTINPWNFFRILNHFTSRAADYLFSSKKIKEKAKRMLINKILHLIIFLFLNRRRRMIFAVQKYNSAWVQHKTENNTLFLI
jgi:hypothetical protein